MVVLAVVTEHAVQGQTPQSSEGLQNKPTHCGGGKLSRMDVDTLSLAVKSLWARLRSRVLLARAGAADYAATERVSLSSEHWVCTLLHI